MCKLLNKLFLILSVFVLGLNTSAAKEVSNPKIISLAPAVTEIIYALDVQDNLIGVSTACNYPKEAMLKEKVGDAYFLNKEKIIRLNPDYIFVPDNSHGLLSDFEGIKIKPVIFNFETIDDIYKNIYKIGEMTNSGQKADLLVKDIKTKIAKSSSKNPPKKIFYMIQTDPIITVGKKSFITDVIKKSGNIPAAEDINLFYPPVSDEYAIKTEPDIVVVCFAANNARIKQLFPKSKIIFLTQEQIDMINRPGPRIYRAVEFFSKLN